MSDNRITIIEVEWCRLKSSGRYGADVSCVADAVNNLEGVLVVTDSDLVAQVGVNTCARGRSSPLDVNTVVFVVHLSLYTGGGRWSRTVKNVSSRGESAQTEGVDLLYIDLEVVVGTTGKITCAVVKADRSGAWADRITNVIIGCRVLGFTLQNELIVVIVCAAAEVLPGDSNSISIRVCNCVYLSDTLGSIVNNSTAAGIRSCAFAIDSSDLCPDLGANLEVIGALLEHRESNNT